MRTVCLILGYVFAGAALLLSIYNLYDGRRKK